MEWLLVDELDNARSADEQMAADLAMLDRVLAGGPPMLRLYRWSPPALSIGRHQSVEDVDHARCDALGVAVTRRPTGGRALLHGADLTYAVAMPRPDACDGVLGAYAHLAEAIVDGLARVGIHATVAMRAGERGAACFASHEGADLAVDGRKICGSAQLQREGALLQHGAILLDRMPFAEPDLLVYPDRSRRDRDMAQLRAATVTVAELGGPADARTVGDALIAGFVGAHGVQFRPGSLGPMLAAAGKFAPGHPRAAASA